MMLKFSQLGGSFRTLELADHAAPFGRPRIGAVANDKITLRESEVFVAGSSTPIRHVHGIKHGDWELNGRFSDYHGSEGFAAAKTAEVKRFVAEMQPVRVTWGTTLAGVGLITEFDPGRESEGETEWKMTVKISSDDLIEQVIDIPQRKRPADHINQILLLSTEIEDAFEGMQLKGGVFDVFNSAISSLAGLTGFVVGIANEIQSFESELIGSLRRFRAALGQLKTAAIIVRETVDAFPADIAIEAAHADTQFAFLRGQATISDSALSMIRELGEADRSAQRAEQDKVLTIHEAKGGDSFESISSHYYGNASRAEEIRNANGVAAGQPPEAGQLYVVPV